MNAIVLRRRARPLRRLLQAPATLRHIRSQQTVQEALREVRDRLRRELSAPSGLDAASSAAKALVADALQPRLASSSDVFFHGERQLAEQEAARLRESVEQRAKGEPLAYVLGRKEFWSLEFEVTRDTLIPRSDSEVLIETLVVGGRPPHGAELLRLTQRFSLCWLTWQDQFHPQTPLRILDVGTGSGCLLLSALSEFPRATGVGIDISPGALAVAKQNARIHDFDGRAEFLLRDLQALPQLRADVVEDEELYQRFDVILCNPPYIPCQELHLVGPDVLEYEPHLALFSDGGPTAPNSGADPEGLRMYRLVYESVARLFKDSTKPRHSSTRNCLLMEIGSQAQAQAVQKLFFNVTQAPTGSHLEFERFLFDANGKYRGLLFLSP
ncbi:unnamed protein product [Phytophthora lilii]|uniref:Unnamed protein product n=1 Tax=Phytophthora lilii TaxID=2077276 RepID=A0A9W6U2C0_9STRA|nr:unnamed protein product [Phytophthora lilii]